jgi:hypothetical protein
MSDTLNIFSLDVEAEIRKLTNRRYKVSFESVLDLVRAAMGWGARSIRISMSKRALSITAKGVKPQAAAFQLVERIYDSSRSPEERQHALDELEKAHGLYMMGAFFRNPRMVAIEWWATDGMRGIRFTKKGGPVRYVPKGRSALKIAVTRRFGGAKERRAVCERCRFSEVPVFMNDFPVSGGRRVEQSLLQVDVVKEGLDGVVGLPSEGDVSCVTRLEKGIISDEVVIPITGGLLYSAVVEDGGREWDETVQVLRSAGRTLYYRLAERYEKLSDEGKERALELLFDRYWHTRRDDLLKGVRAFHRIDGAPLDFLQVRALVSADGVLAIDRDASPSHYDLKNRIVLSLTKKQRQFLESNLEIVLLAPPRREQFHTLGERLRSMLRPMAVRFRQLICRPGRLVDDRALNPLERQFLKTLRNEVRTGRFSISGAGDPAHLAFAMGDSSRLPWALGERGAKGLRYRIPRRHPAVQAMVRKVARDPAYLYPALVLLSDGAVAPSEET